MINLYSFALGVGTKNSRGEWLEVYYPRPLLNPPAALGDLLASVLGSDIEVEPSTEQLSALQSALQANGYSDQAAAVTSLLGAGRPLVAVMLANDSAPASVPQGYLKLHLLSHRLVKPHGTDLSGIFGVLKNVAWTSAGPIDIEELPERVLQARLAGLPLSVDCVDKFPKMVDYVVPSGVRIADTSRVRLGAYVGEGTTVMHEGFINFNAGTEGPNMVEGRVSAGVFCGAGSDVGGGASIMGTLSGGGSMVISMGEKCLLGANAGLGIPLGDRCTLEAGLYITAGTVVSMLDDQKQLIGKVKARDLAGKSDLLFRRNSVTGSVECLTNKSAVELNESLHASN
ncbi:MAG: 2,3,4,5-tetrahydropyridine-2,6-dicarboxylate N-succinyltransferase [Porticoccaceae bacterium]|jgi:2,3,4,5-tetrahydropyridine-2,6-dicarboxylate N-succinyltransferase|nr:2,3,4,5-tetrahydropyridine-2,6-dicarboxylate N-succinyltransferase [Porticoccaceae bacterium]MBT5577658.1 2,3,4,5-tetrahydropyridine-2,6-dicarboxylate N-succinyltransferase [Porticoccaceae bacterium]